MTRLIDAEELKEYLEEAYEAGCINKYYNMQRRTIFDEVLDCVDEQPTVDAEPVRHGKWIDEGYYADHTPVKAWHCSECNWHMLGYSDELFRYCPMCGARMGEE